MLIEELDAFSGDDASFCVDCESSINGALSQNEFSQDAKERLVDFFATLLEVELEEKGLLSN